MIVASIGILRILNSSALIRSRGSNVACPVSSQIDRFRPWPHPSPARFSRGGELHGCMPAQPQTKLEGSCIEAHEVRSPSWGMTQPLRLANGCERVALGSATARVACSSRPPFCRRPADHANAADSNLCVAGFGVPIALPEPDGWVRKLGVPQQPLPRRSRFVPYPQCRRRQCG